MFHFKLTTIFCWGYRLSKHKMTICSKNLVGHVLLDPLATPMSFNTHAYMQEKVCAIPLKIHVISSVLTPL